MATTSKKLSENIFSRIRTSLKNRKKNPDWARVEEPDTIIKPMVFAYFGIIITALSVLMAWAVMTISPIMWIASFLASLHSSLPFDQLYAAFASAVIVLINLVLMILFMLIAPATNDDIVEMISDLDANIQERIVELDNTINANLDEIKRNV